MAINCEELQYFQEDQSESDYDEDDIESKGRTATTQHSTLVNNRLVGMGGLLGHSGSDNDEELKSSAVLTKSKFRPSQKKRDAISDTEEEAAARETMGRKADMLNVGSLDEEFEIKSACKRRKSEDFTREKHNLMMMSKQASFEFYRAEDQRMRKNTTFKKRRPPPDAKYFYQ